jgi:hypothetical protein
MVLRVPRLRRMLSYFGVTDVKMLFLMLAIA